ncbi:MAG: hydroxyacid dehydrogenase [Candidatus Lokiarchaeota archaeon]|nr:hydroxyacid dehydrogenase [Candidatus Lokiarchaeota archaeon]
MKLSVLIRSSAIEALNFSKENKKKLEDLLPDIDVIVHNTPKSFRDDLSDVDIALVWNFKPSWIKRAPILKWIAVPSAGTDYMSKDDYPERIKFTNSTFHGKIMAETVLGAMLGFSRGLFWNIKNFNEFQWPRNQIDNYSTTLKGSHLAILGYGHIGRYIAELAKPFGVRITGIKRTMTKKPSFFEENDKIITIESLDSILPYVDHLVVVLPRTESTNNIIEKERLNLLPKKAYLYNIGRGNAINEAALIDSLNQEKISGAYLDVFENEPLADDSPLRKCPNIVLTPHSSAIAPNFLNLFIDEFVERYKKWIAT